ncbi:hypothetical protein [Mesorhizobium sp.]|uniref:hypothetical protein n=1 Tax=Mesorhizobium sp. TaxID=1871066 RepID=UPI000FE61A0B|nr:hypothetical protein [Mesorhizobium sp.]RWA79895.1 MAG: hypothetical protein EOQ30_23710 [Mesorhizobium sp.]
MDKRALFFEDGSFTFPLFVKSIAAVPEDYRDFYSPVDEGGEYRLKDLYWKELRLPFEREYEQLERQLADLKAKHETDMAREKRARHRGKIDNTLHSACKGAGIPDGLIKGAMSLLSAKATFEVDESYEFGGGVVVATRDGVQNSVEGLVESFLDSDEGAGFRGKRRAPPSDGYFTSLLGRR